MNFKNILEGLLVAAVSGAAASAGQAAVSGQPITGRNVGGAAIGGAVTGILAWLRTSPMDQSAVKTQEAESNAKVAPRL
jgi:hypothetical protein